MSEALPFSLVRSVIPSPTETGAFGFGVARLSIGGRWIDDRGGFTALVSSIVRSLDTESVNTIILRFPSELVGLARLSETATRRLNYAGTLVYWEDPRVDAPRGSGPGRVEVSGSGIEPSRDFINDAVAVIADSFEGYVNHYAYNGRIPENVAHAGYVDWTQRTIADPMGIGIVVRDETGPVAVATVRLHSGDTGGVAEVELAGVISACQGAGWYSYLWGAIREAVTAAGYDRLIISTQASNTRVQRAWARLGLVPLASFVTVHAELQSSNKD